MDDYVRLVLDGTILACEWVRLACERHLRDLAASATTDWPYRFDAAKAERVCRFAELLPHIKGRWAAGTHAQRLVLELWQCFLICSVFGWVSKSTGLRRFRKVRAYLPRKNGKSTTAAPIGLYMFAADGEAGAEVYSGATSEKQAWEVFGPARLMAERTPELCAKYGIEVNAKSLIRLGEMSKFEPIIGKPGDGASPHCSIADEYHEHATDDQVATMETGMGAREQPLSIVISTAGDNIAGPCRDDWLHCQKILQRIFEDDRTFALIYTIDADDDWTSEAALRKANPNFGVSVDGEFLLQQQRDAIMNPRQQGRFKTKHLNLWVQARDAYINMLRWRDSGDTRLTIEQFHRGRCWVGMDLASKIDLAALEILFERGNGFVRFGRYYLPEATVELPENQHYRAWRDLDLITVTPGNMIDFARIRDDLIDLRSQVEMVALGYDPHQATMLVTQLQEEGVPVVEFAPTVLNFSEPMKQIDALIREGSLAHDGDPVMEWAMSNVVARVDAKDNVYPRKEQPQNKIDPFVALCMAMGLAMQDGGAPDLSSFLSNPVIG